MKKFLPLLLVFLFITICSIDAMNIPGRNNHRHNHQRPGSVRAPLDGGALIILGAAGIGYFITKKNKVKP